MDIIADREVGQDQEIGNGGVITGEMGEIVIGIIGIDRIGIQREIDTIVIAVSTAITQNPMDLVTQIAAQMKSPQILTHR